MYLLKLCNMQFVLSILNVVQTYSTHLAKVFTVTDERSRKLLTEKLVSRYPTEVDLLSKWTSATI